MNRALPAARSGGALIGDGGDHLIHVHVALRARAGLPGREGELAVGAAARHNARRLDDELRLIGGEESEFGVDACRSTLNGGKGVDHLKGHAVVANGEEVQGAGRLGAPVLIGWDLDLTERVALRARLLCVAHYRLRYGRSAPLL